MNCRQEESVRLQDFQIRSLGSVWEQSRAVWTCVGTSTYLPDDIARRDNCKCDTSKLRQLEEEEPELHIIWNEELQEIQVQIMGGVQLEILKSLIKERFDVDVEFGQGNIVYKETIAGCCRRCWAFWTVKTLCRSTFVDGTAGEGKWSCYRHTVQRRCIG